MNPANVPPWGCPWHGPVQGGQLQLPNGASMAYPQPLAKQGIVNGNTIDIPDTWGSAQLLAVPGVPAVARTPEEQAADDAAGRQWRNVATLSGGRQALYGRSITGWIYVDPAGDIWRVRSEQIDENVNHDLSTPLAVTVVLSRFGVLGAPLEEYSYPVSISNFGIDGGTPPATGRLLLEAIRPDGGAVVLMVHERKMVNLNVQQIRWPHSFLELSITGPGGSAVVSVSVARLRSQTMRVTRDFDYRPTHMVGWFRDTPEAEPYWRVASLDSLSAAERLEFTSQGGRTAIIKAGDAWVNITRLLSLWYGAGGALVEVASELRWTAAIDYPTPSGADPRVSTISASWSEWIQAGAHQSGVIAGTLTCTVTDNIGDPEPAATRDTHTVTDGVEATTSEAVTEGIGTTTPLHYGNGYNTLDVSADDLIRKAHTDFLMGGARVTRYSPQVIGLVASRPPNVQAYRPPVTPSGSPGALSLRTDANESLYGSWCPVTGQATWLETAPVCYV